MKQTGSFSISASHPALPGHFPGNPIVPGVVLMDHAFAAVLADTADQRVVAVPRVKFLRPVLPEQHVTVFSEPPSDAARVRFRCEVEGITVLEGVLRLSTNQSCTADRNGGD